MTTYDVTTLADGSTKRVSYDSVSMPRTNKRAVKFGQGRRQSSLNVHKTFLRDFHDSTVGGWLVILLGFLSAVGVGCLVGVVPQVATQLYAERIIARSSNEDGVDDLVSPPTCVTSEPQDACFQGAGYARAAAAYSVLARNVMSLLINSIAGSYSDTHGRRGLQIFSLFLSALTPIALILIQIFRTINPAWFFATESFSGIINWFSIAFTQLSDSTPARHRAAAYGLYMGAFLSGIALAPFLATVMSHIQIAIFSCIVRSSALAIAVVFLPETLPAKRTNSEGGIVGDDEAIGRIDEEPRHRGNGCYSCLLVLLRPFYEMSILGRNQTVRAVAFGAFMSKMVFSGDVTLFFYYVENTLSATVGDVALMMLATGTVGVLVQAGLLKYLISMLGERQLLIVSFVSGTIHNLIYGLAPNKQIIIAGVCLAQFTNINGPLLSAIASRNVANTEQGRIQGALFGLTSLAEAVGPLCFNLVVRVFSSFPGSMFLFGAFIYFLGFLAVSMIPPKAAEIMTPSSEIVRMTLDGNESYTEGETVDDEDIEERSRLIP